MIALKLRIRFRFYIFIYESIMQLNLLNLIIYDYIIHTLKENMVLTGDSFVQFH